jgi:hypothetical protein
VPTKQLRILKGEAMGSYTITSTCRPRGFEVRSSDGNQLAQLLQPKLFSQDMEGTVAGTSVRLVSEGFWRMHYRIEVDGVPVGKIRTGGWGVFKITLQRTTQAPIELEFTHAGPWWKRYHLRVDKNLPLVELDPRFRWATFSQDYVVTLIGQGIAPEQLPLLLALCGFCARLKRARSHAASA